MRSILLTFLIAGASTVLAQTSSAQKIGHADWEYIFRQLPEYMLIQNELSTFDQQLQNQLAIKSKELEAKYANYKALPDNTPEAIRNDKEAELAYLQQNLQKFQQEAEAAIQKKQRELIAPVLQKVGKAIETVAVENGFAYIINPQMLGGGDVLLYGDEKYNISILVLKKLGVTVNTPTTTE